MIENASPGAGTLELGGDLRVNRLGFGTMRLCGPGVWGEPEDPRAAEAVLRRVVELGIPTCASPMRAETRYGAI